LFVLSTLTALYYKLTCQSHIRCHKTNGIVVGLIVKLPIKFDNTKISNSVGIRGWFIFQRKCKRPMTNAECCVMTSDRKVAQQKLLTFLK